MLVFFKSQTPYVFSPAVPKYHHTCVPALIFWAACSAPSVQNRLPKQVTDKMLTTAYLTLTGVNILNKEVKFFASQTGSQNISWRKREKRSFSSIMQTW